ncbi:hypothetical protein MMC30_004221 [Trapelia coarctata]|nr:hypothetical protein [Trapelia coarctata]
MTARIAKTHIRSSRAKLFNASQEKLLDAVVGEGIGASRRSRQQSADIGDLARAPPPVHSWEKRTDATVEIVPLLAKRTRLTRTNLQRLRIKDKEAEQAVKFVQSIQQPKPFPLKRPYTSFLEDFVGQASSSPAPKRYHPESVNSFVTQWLESTSGSRSYRERHCRSDSLLGHSDGEPISRRLTQSAPNMEYTRDANGFVVPPTPSSTGPRSNAPSLGPLDAASAGGGSGRSSGRSLVEEPLYRVMNLAANNIYMRPAREQFPEHIASLVGQVRRDRDSPGPSPDQIRQDTDLDDLEMGTGEYDVEGYFKDKIFPRSAGPSKRSDRFPMAKRAVPDVGSYLKVSTPVPDMLYGYNRNGAFLQQQTQLISIGTEMVANNQDLVYPFFVVEFKADGPSGSGSLWVTTNQCLGGSTSCVNIAERLNHQLRQCKSDKVLLIDSAAFSVAMSGTEARLYISWKHDELKYYMQKVDSFLLQDPEHYLKFRKYVRNIIDWGKDERLKEIRNLLDNPLEESRRRNSEAAKSRPTPSDDAASSSGHKLKALRKEEPQADSRKGKGKASQASAGGGKG